MQNYCAIFQTRNFLSFQMVLIVLYLSHQEAPLDERGFFCYLPFNIISPTQLAPKPLYHRQVANPARFF